MFIITTIIGTVPLNMLTSALFFDFLSLESYNSPFLPFVCRNGATNGNHQPTGAVVGFYPSARSTRYFALINGYPIKSTSIGLACFLFAFSFAVLCSLDVEAQLLIFPFLAIH